MVDHAIIPSKSEELVLGLQPIEMRKGDPGYWQITTGLLHPMECVAWDTLNAMSQCMHRH